MENCLDFRLASTKRSGKTVTYPEKCQVVWSNVVGIRLIVLEKVPHAGEIVLSTSLDDLRFFRDHHLWL